MTTLVRRPMPAPEPKPDLAPIIFNGRGIYLATGQHTRQVYQFSAQAPEQLINANDIEALVNTGFFQAKS